ncbi:unnamed protein product (macronuclear) [Paramecium tetraurelia]|uniref:Cyclic nucleotide-binding domain-containing protein n=1 Tax=Paramecium tetraurelia TaxID=5888 RepID=A0CWB5_PARTE|nr:uncharacterized protein GSPATT00001284001 [Paramecium tetraurelia]CAK75082.1 unnamed protein product [Paramecium tetraurelia]|eukprot:XP_001442479.1 hypothetical protein (macronuclear) [Paramecium tetraurelia strain d4-2]
MNEIKQNEYLLKNRKEKEWLNRKQLKFLRDTAVTSDDSGDEFEKQKQFEIFIKQKKQFQWEERSITIFSLKFGKVYSEVICLKINHYLMQLGNLFKKIKKNLTPLPPYIITPDGSIKMIWDLLCLSFVIYEMISIPFQISFEIEISKEISMTSLVVFALDILLNFNTGVYLDGILSMKREKIIRNYLSFWFWIDLISTFPYDIIIDESESLIQSAKLLRLFKFLKFIHILKLLRLAKLKKIIDLLDEVIQNIRILGIVITFCKLFVFVLFLAHVLGCIFHYASREESNSWLGDNENADWQIRYIYSLYWGIATMTTVGYGDISPTTTTERGLGIILLLVACGGFAFTMNSIGFALSSLEERTNVRKSKVNVLNKYMKQANIPDGLQNKVRKYLEYVWDSHQILLNDITSLLSLELCKDILEQVNGKLFGHIDIFWQFHSQKFLVEGIIPILEDKLYLPEEVIFNEIPSTNYDLYLIQKGEASIYFMKTNIVIDNKTKYDYFGEISFFTNQVRSASAQSKQFSHIFILNQSKYLEIAKIYPRDLQQYFNIRNSILFEKDYSFLQVRCYVCQMDDHIAKECPVLHFQVNAPHFLSFLHQYYRVYQASYIRKDRIDFNARSSSYQIQQSQRRFLQINSRRQTQVNSKGPRNSFFVDYYDVDFEDLYKNDKQPSRLMATLKNTYFNNKNKKKFDLLNMNIDSPLSSKRSIGAITQRIMIEEQQIDQIASDRFNDLLDQLNTIKQKKRSFTHIHFTLLPDFEKIQIYNNFSQWYNIENVLERYKIVQQKGLMSQIPHKYTRFGLEEFISYQQYYCFYLKKSDIYRYYTKCHKNQGDVYYGFENGRIFNLNRVEKKRSKYIKVDKFRRQDFVKQQKSNV